VREFDFLEKRKCGRNQGWIEFERSFVSLKIRRDVFITSDIP